MKNVAESCGKSQQVELRLSNYCFHVLKKYNLDIKLFQLLKVIIQANKNVSAAPEIRGN